MTGKEPQRKRAVLHGLLLASAVVAALLLVFWPGAGKPRAAGVLPGGGEKEVVLLDPPAPVLLRWKFPLGQTLIYALTEKKTERLGQSVRVTDSSGTLTLRGLGNGEGEAELVLVRGSPGGGAPAGGVTAEQEAGAPADAEAQALAGQHQETAPREARPVSPPPGSAPPAGALQQSFTLDSRGRPVGPEARAEVFLNIFGVDFPFPEEEFRRGNPVTSKRESPLGMGAAGLLTRRQRWTKTVERAGYPSLRLEGETHEDTSTPPRAGYRILTSRKSTTLCYFAYEQGYLVEWAVRREEEATSSGEAGAKALAGTIFRTQEVSLKLLEARSEGRSAGPAAQPGPSRE